MKTKFLLLFVVFFGLLAGCQSEVSSKASPPKAPPTINQTNDLAFIKKLANDYLQLAQDLETQSNYFESQNDLDGFLSYRNKEWTPNYMSKKLFYDKSFEKNATYISQQKLGKPFEVFSSLIYIGLDLKHGLQNEDATLLAKAYKLLKKDTEYMQQVKAL